MLRGQLRCVRRGVKLLNSTRYFAVDSNETRKKIVVFGGSGYVGSNVVQAALRSGHEVVSINRNAPAFSDNPHLTYRAGDVLKADDWRDELTGCDAVISCVGCFGNNEKMLRINGDGNVNVITEALLQGVPRVVYVSTVENNLPDFLLRGYFEGKRRAEQALLEAFPEPGTGVVLRPSFIYGHRKVALRNPLSPSSEAALDVPLNLLGRPLELLLSNPLADKLRNVLPGMQAPLAPPISVSDVAAAAVLVAEGAEQTRALCATPPSSRTRNVLAVGDIKQLVANAARHRNTPSPPRGKEPEQSTQVSTASASTNVFRQAAATSSHPSARAPAAVDNVEAAAADPAGEATEQSVADEKKGPDNSTGRSV